MLQETTEAHPRKEYRRKARGMNLSRVIYLISLPESQFQVAISVQPGVVRHSYEARVTHISEDFLSALILESISISAPVDDRLHEKLRGVVLEVDDIIEVKHSCLTIKRGVCQLRGKFVRILRKG
ncbi:hypothetical protein OSTOST_05057 [Ostertagia ostertagi]